MSWGGGKSREGTWARCTATGDTEKCGGVPALWAPGPRARAVGEEGLWTGLLGPVPGKDLQGVWGRPCYLPHPQSFLGPRRGGQ